MPHLVWKFYGKSCFSFWDTVRQLKKWTKNNNNSQKELDQNQESSPLLRWSLIKLHLNRGEDSWFPWNSFLAIIFFSSTFFNWRTKSQKLKLLSLWNFHTRWNMLWTRECVLFIADLSAHIRLTAIFFKSFSVFTLFVHFFQLPRHIWKTKTSFLMKLSHKMGHIKI